MFTAVAEPWPGDFDQDGDVDGADFLMWQRGESPNSLSQSDLFAWHTNFGTVGPLMATSTTVPEPSAWIMLLLGLATGGVTGREHPIGPLMFQGNYGAVAYRNIRITPR